MSKNAISYVPQVSNLYLLKDMLLYKMTFVDILLIVSLKAPTGHFHLITCFGCLFFQVILVSAILLQTRAGLCLVGLVQATVDISLAKHVLVCQEKKSNHFCH